MISSSAELMSVYEADGDGAYRRGGLNVDCDISQYTI